MTEDKDSLFRAARELIETDQAMGGQFIPAERNPLPAAEPQAGGDSGDDEEKRRLLQEIDEKEVKSCSRCGLCKNRTNTVFGEGNPDADLVFVGEGPGAEEDRTGRPFVGRAGELLTKMIDAMGMSREDVFICNIIKCRAPGNRSPAPEEAAACWDYLMRQLQIIQPRVIVTLGNPATQNLLDTKVGITRMRGTWQKLPMIADGLTGIDVMPTFHPAFLLRQYSLDNRKKVWGDLQEVMKLLGIEPPKK